MYSEYGANIDATSKVPFKHVLNKTASSLLSSLNGESFIAFLKSANDKLSPVKSSYTAPSIAPP